MGGVERPGDLGKLLLAEHNRLDTVFEQLLCSFDSGDPTTCQGAWTDFERSLLRHLEYEEASLLPKLQRTNPQETAALREQHTTLRKLVAELGVQLDLHAVKAETVRQMIAFLREHAAREENLLYPWASQLPREVANPFTASGAQVGEPPSEIKSAQPA